MGIEFLRQQCGASATETDALVSAIPLICQIPLTFSLTVVVVYQERVRFMLDTSSTVSFD